ncbi:hypothetical protein GPEL0_01r4081 [Geoanaerobacter pelophilus]|uniref:Uncharacterized protein n=1 Tax=Geoanaerobacter pelophilus TaxID=60036 RepID=A0ABQ0MLL6_9BACT|nr:hypothetical protein [Geoanaerobacter pelophilus]GAW67969.1 hypothetical protein GPEL0_01r4081 [Geoanaerobacter pelophilus]
MELSVTQNIYYSSEKKIQLTQVAESLLALERIICRTPAALEKLFPDTQIEKVYVYIDKLESGSIYEDIVVKFVFGSQENLDDFILKSRNACGMETLDKKPILKLLILSTILFGGVYAASYFGSSKESKTVIQNQYNYAIKLGSELSGTSVEQFKDIIESSVSSRSSLAKDTTKFIRPAKFDKKSFIYFDIEKEVFIPPEVIRAVPASLREDISDEYLKDFTNVEVSIRAIDLDSFKRGWAVVIDVISDKRIPLQLDNDINPESLIGLRSFNGDVTVMYERGESGDIPKKVFLRKIIN